MELLDKRPPALKLFLTVALLIWIAFSLKGTLRDVQKLRSTVKTTEGPIIILVIAAIIAILAITAGYFFDTLSAKLLYLLIGFQLILAVLYVIARALTKGR